MSNKFCNHLRTVIKHKKEVFKAMCECGHPVQGLLHDMSKFSPVEFFTSVKYYQGTESPVNAEKRDKGYSTIWLHHKSKNKHHSQYWLDCSLGETVPCEMPWKYLLELICDTIGAGKVYAKNKGETWTKDYPINYYKSVDYKSYYHEVTRKKLVFYYEQISEYGWEYVAHKIKCEGDFYTQLKDLNIQ